MPHTAYDTIRRIVKALEVRYNFEANNYADIDYGRWWIEVGPEIAEILYDSLEPIPDRSHGGVGDPRECVQVCQRNSRWIQGLRTREDCKLADKLFAEELEKEGKRELEQELADLPR